MMEPGDRHKSDRFFEGPWSIDSASDPEPGEVRSYARHARSIPARRRRQRVLAFALAGALVAAIGVAVPRAIRLFTRPPDASLDAAAALRDRAADWIARWARSDLVACDQLMCSALQAHGLTATRLTVLTSSSIDPQNSDVVVETALTHSMFGNRLATVYAPAVLAKFGHGKARITIRVTSQVGSAARYERALRANVQLRRAAGRALHSNSHVAESAVAARQLAGGRVDLRILATLALFAPRYRLTILRFGGAAPGSSWGMPLLSIDLTATDSTGNNAVTARYARIVARGPLVSAEGPRPLAWMMTSLSAQIQPLRAARFSERTTQSGMAYLHIVFAAPTVIPFTGLSVPQ